MIKKYSILLGIFLVFSLSFVIAEIPQVIITTSTGGGYVFYNSTIFNITNNNSYYVTNNITNNIYNGTNVTNNITTYQFANGSASGICPSGQALQNITVVTNSTGMFIIRYECASAGGSGTNYWGQNATLLYALDNTKSVQFAGGIANDVSSFASTRGIANYESCSADSQGTCGYIYSHADSQGTSNAAYSHADSGGVVQGTAGYGHADSTGNAIGDYSHADSGGNAIGVHSHAEGGGYTDTAAEYAHADSLGTAYGNASFASGTSSVTGNRGTGFNGAVNPFENYFMIGGSAGVTNDNTKVPIDGSNVPTTKLFVSSPDVVFGCSGTLTDCSEITADPPCSSVSGCSWEQFCEGTYNCEIYNSVQCYARDPFCTENPAVDCSLEPYPDCLSIDGCSDDSYCTDPSCTDEPTCVDTSGVCSGGTGGECGGGGCGDCTDETSCLADSCDWTPNGCSSTWNAQCTGTGYGGCSGTGDCSTWTGTCEDMNGCGLGAFSCTGGTPADTDCNQISYADCHDTSDVCSTTVNGDLTTITIRAGIGQTNPLIEGLDDGANQIFKVNQVTGAVTSKGCYYLDGGAVCSGGAGSGNVGGLDISPSGGIYNFPFQIKSDGSFAVYHAGSNVWSKVDIGNTGYGGLAISNYQHPTSTFYGISTKGGFMWTSNSSNPTGSSGRYSGSYEISGWNSTKGNNLTINFTKTIIDSNVSISQLLTLDVMTLPTCATATNGSIGRNNTGLYYCNNTAQWSRLG